jgi:hypothetical protein
LRPEHDGVVASQKRSDLIPNHRAPREREAPLKNTQDRIQLVQYHLGIGRATTLWSGWNPKLRGAELHPCTPGGSGELVPHSPAAQHLEQFTRSG